MTDAETKCRELVRAAGVDPDRATRHMMFRYYVGLYLIGVVTAESMQSHLRSLAVMNPSIKLQA